MRILVCAKQVPDMTEVKIDSNKGKTIREEVPGIINPVDANALEAALTIKDENPGTEVIVMTMGPFQAFEMLRECLAMGADEVYLLNDQAFSGADTWATSATLVAGIKKIDNIDLILTGRQSIDGYTAQVGPQIAQRLEIPVVTAVQNIKVIDRRVVVQRQLEDRYEVIDVKFPCLLTCMKELNEPRYMSIGGIMDAYQQSVTAWNHEDIGLSLGACGLDGSLTRVHRSFVPPTEKLNTTTDGSVINKIVSSVMSKLKSKHQS